MGRVLTGMQRGKGQKGDPIHYFKCSPLDCRDLGRGAEEEVEEEKERKHMQKIEGRFERTCQ